MSYENITLERDGEVAVLTINRPKVLNALNSATIHEIEKAIEEVAADDAVRGLVITGAGDKAFAAGADIGELNALPSAYEGMALSARDHEILLKLAELPKVVIAAINGYALGGGFELALGCDIRLASATAQVGLPEVTLGLIPGWGGALRMARLIGPGMTKYLVMSGERLAAEEAQRLGIVEKVYPPEELLPAAVALARKIGANAPLATAAAKQLIDRGEDMSLRDAIAYETGLFGHLTATEDCKEGTAAFLARRKAEWKAK
ncbi:MAG TPA: enoyl-CoA hydratase-related protein [Herpetosiphonaceae bacterium]